MGERVRPDLFYPLMGLDRSSIGRHLVPSASPPALATLRTAFAPLVLLLAACAPSVTPLYRDYEARGLAADSGEAAADVLGRVRTALAEAGWAEATPLVAGTVAAAPRSVSDWGLYRTEVALDVTPIGGRYVRVLFHPYRRFITGGRSKLPYLGSGLARRLLTPLNEAFARHGLVALGTPRERDERATAGT